MAKIYGKHVKISIQTDEILLDGGIRVESYQDITEHVLSLGGFYMNRYAIRKIHAPLLDIAKVHQSILATNPSWTRAVDYNSLFYAVVVECENKPADIGNIAWIELKEI